MITKIIWEDNNLVVLNKPAGVLTHPTSPRLRGTSPTQKNENNTIVDFIISKWPTIRQSFHLCQGYDGQVGRQADQSRIGIVHRLDQDTSGLILIAKNPKTLAYLQEQFQKRTIMKKYLALVLGKVEPKEGEIVSYLSRDNSGTIKHKSTHFNFSWQKKKSKLAITKYHVINYYAYYILHATYYISLLELEIKTGRTHQIRAHLKSKNWPIIGDQIYNTKESKKVSKKLGLSRQFLHSYKVKFELPNANIKEFTSELPNELNHILSKLTISAIGE